MELIWSEMANRVPFLICKAPTTMMGPELKHRCPPASFQVVRTPCRRTIEAYLKASTMSTTNNAHISLGIQVKDNGKRYTKDIQKAKIITNRSHCIRKGCETRIIPKIETDFSH